MENQKLQLDDDMMISLPGKTGKLCHSALAIISNSMFCHRAFGNSQKDVMPLPQFYTPYLLRVPLISRGQTTANRLTTLLWVVRSHCKREKGTAQHSECLQTFGMPPKWTYLRESSYGSRITALSSALQMNLYTLPPKHTPCHTFIYLFQLF